MRALARSPSNPHIVVAPGNAGIARDARTVPVDAGDPAAVVALARDVAAALVVIGPEAPLVAGVADALRDAGFRVFGPGAAGARLEGSKAFAKEVMAAAGVPTAASRVVTTVAEGLAAVDHFGLPVAVKADGLAAGKGVVVAQTRDEAERALGACLDDRAFGDAGAVVVVEEGLTGREVSLIAVCSGQTVARLPAARDYKPVGDGNTGPNTGGMGSVSPVPDIPDDVADALVDAIHRPMLAELARRGIDFRGALYAGLMMTPQGARVIEFNVRFGDPETQVLLPRVTGDALALLGAAADGTLADGPVDVNDGAAVAVVLAAHGYPASPRSGDEISGLDEAAADGADVYHAGTSADGHRIVTSGGRVLAVSALGTSIADARARAYAAAGRIQFDGRHQRNDIAEGLDT